MTTAKILQGVQGWQIFIFNFGLILSLWHWKNNWFFLHSCKVETIQYKCYKYFKLIKIKLRTNFSECKYVEFSRDTSFSNKKNNFANKSIHCRSIEFIKKDVQFFQFNPGLSKNWICVWKLFEILRERMNAKIIYQII